MSICKDILRGHDVSCLDLPFKKYYQQVVLINRGDVDQVGYDITDTTHAIVFNLTGGSTGYLYRANENVALINASFSKGTSGGRTTYTHTIEVPVTGVGVQTKLVLKELDLSDYFAAVQYRDETIEIYGFENGLRADDYTYNAQNGLGGTVITLSSRYGEDDPPYVYLGDKDNFNNLFAGIGDLLGGDFNDDFSDDFYIIEI